MNRQVKIEIVSGVGKECLLIDDIRVSGPEPLGGGTVIKSFPVASEAIEVALGIEENWVLKEKFDTLVKHRSTIIDHAISLEKLVIQLKKQIEELEKK